MRKMWKLCFTLWQIATRIFMVSPTTRKRQRNSLRLSQQRNWKYNFFMTPPADRSVMNFLKGDGNISVLDWFKLSFYSNFPVKQKQNSRIMASIFNRTWVQWSRFMDRRMIKLEDIVVAKSLWPSVWSTIHTSWPFWSRAELGFL